MSALSHETGGTPQDSARFREMLQPAGCADELRVSFTDGFGVWGHLTLFSRRRFSTEQGDLAATLVPLVARALRSELRAEHPPADGPAGDGPAVVVVSAAGETIAADARVRSRLADLATPDRDRCPGVSTVARGPILQWCSSGPSPDTTETAMTDAPTETPVLDTLAAMTAESLARCGLDVNSLVAVRIAALVAVDAPAASYLAHVGPAMDAGVTVEQVQDILIAVAPIVGTPRTLSAAAKITEALGIVIVAVEAELDAELEAEEQAG